MPTKLHKQVKQRRKHFALFHISFILLLSVTFLMNAHYNETGSAEYRKTITKDGAIQSVRVKPVGNSGFDIIVEPGAGKANLGSFKQLQGLLEFDGDVYVGNSLLEQYHLTPPLKMSCLFNEKEKNVVVYLTDKNLTMTKDTLWLFQ